MALNLLHIGKRLQKVIAVSLIVLMLPVGNAMADDPGEGDLGDPDEEEVPIDGGISLLLAAGAGIGARKLYQSKKKQNSKNADFTS